MGSQSQTPLRQLLISKQLITALRRRREKDGAMGRGPQGGWERAETEQRGGLRSNPVATALSPCDDRTQYGPLHASPARSTCRSWAQWVNTGPHFCADQSSVPAGVPRGCHKGGPQVALQGAISGSPCPPHRDPHPGRCPALNLRSACSQH